MRFSVGDRGVLGANLQVFNTIMSLSKISILGLMRSKTNPLMQEISSLKLFLP